MGSVLSPRHIPSICAALLDVLTCAGRSRSPKDRYDRLPDLVFSQEVCHFFYHHKTTERHSKSGGDFSDLNDLDTD